MSPVSLANIRRHAPYRASIAAVLTGAWMAAAAGDSLAQPKAPMMGAAQARQLAAGNEADPECLSITQSSASTYMIENATCPEQSVLAAIELAGDGDLARCFVKKLRTQISIASEGAAPVINYQCIEGATGCSVEVVRDMFPECHAG